MNKNVSIVDILFLFSLIIPRFLELSIPLSLLLGVMIGFGRLSTESELIVIRSIGLNLKRIAKPVLFLASFAFVFCLILSTEIRPLAEYKAGLAIFELAKAKASSGIIPGIFNEMGQLTIYSEGVVDNGKRLTNVIISDRTDENNPKNFFAKNGQIVSDDSQRKLTLRLFDGNILEGVGSSFSITYFDTNNITLPQDQLFLESEKDGKKASEMPIRELLQHIKANNLKKDKNGEMPIEPSTSTTKPKSNQLSIQTNPEDERKKAALLPRRAEVELHRRFALPLSCFFVAILAMALGIQPSRGGHTWGGSVNIIFGVILIMSYYLLIALGTGLGEQGVIPPWSGMWVPDILLAILAFIVFRKIETEQWLSFSQKITDLGQNFNKGILKLKNSMKLKNTMRNDTKQDQSEQDHSKEDKSLNS